MCDLHAYTLLVCVRRRDHYEYMYRFSCFEGHITRCVGLLDIFNIYQYTWQPDPFDWNNPGQFTYQINPVFVHRSTDQHRCEPQHTKYGSDIREGHGRNIDSSYSIHFTLL